MIKKTVIFAIFFSFVVIYLSAQDNGFTFTIPSQDEPVNGAASSETQEEETLPRQWRQLSLGMSLDELKENLLRDGYFNFRGDRDVSFLPVRDQSLVETTGTSFIKRAFFQLRDGEVFIISLTMNTEIIDHYSIFTQFTERYGQPDYLDPATAIWENDETRISIERPLTVKYIDKIVFDDIINESGLIESGHVRLRQEFLNEF